MIQRCESGTPELAVPCLVGSKPRLLMLGRAAPGRVHCAKQTVPIVYAVIGSSALSLSSSSFSPCSWDCSEFATGSFISKAMVNPSHKAFKLPANNPLLKILARKLDWDGAWLTTPRFHFCSQIIIPWSFLVLVSAGTAGSPPWLWSSGWLMLVCDLL